MTAEDTEDLNEDLLEEDLGAPEDALSPEGAEPEDARPAPGFETDTVELGGRAFALEEPNVGITLRILNVIGRLGVRGEKIASRVIRNPGNRAVIMGMLTALDVEDLYSFGAAVLQFEDEKEGRKWLRELGPRGLKLAPLVKAFFINYQKSEDLRESLANFFVGLEMLEGSLSDLGV